MRTVHYLDIVDCNFSHLGCDFISKSLSPGGAMVINMNLNHNNIGDEGIKLLSHGLSLNNMLMCLNL